MTNETTLRIMHVEDTPHDQEYFRRLLCSQVILDYTLEQASNLETVYALLNSQPDRADVIVIDLGLPDSDGIETITNIVKFAPDIPIVSLTGREDPMLASETLKQGAQDYLVKGQLDPASIARTLRHAIERHQLIRNLNKALQKVERLAREDSLTGLPNRKQLSEKMEALLRYADRHPTPFVVLYIDLDNFKLINDTRGHPTGDVVLCEAAKRIEAQLRRSDFISRVGGDEFICILQDIDNPLNAAQIADKIIKSVSSPISIHNECFYVSASIGIAISTKDGTSSDALVSAADSAMYHAKEQGGSQFIFFNEVMNGQLTNRFELEQQLREAIRTEQLQVYYQPIINAEGQIVSCEALLRWQHPQKGLLFPDAFIDLAEESGIIIDIGEYVLRHVMRTFHRWSQFSDQTISISVNISPRHFVRHNFVDRLHILLTEEGLPINYTPWLTLEVTERVLFEPTPAVVDSLKQLVSMKIQLAIDDFGTGYSSLYYLKRLPVNSLKIDKKFVQDITNNTNDRKLLRALLSMAESLSLNTIVEGVETKEQRDCLLEDGCGLMQGFLFSKAVPVEEFNTLSVF